MVRAPTPALANPHALGTWYSMGIIILLLAVIVCLLGGGWIIALLVGAYLLLLLVLSVMVAWVKFLEWLDEGKPRRPPE